MEQPTEKQTEQIGFRVTPTMYKRGEAAAKADKRKLMEWARMAYEAAIEKHEAEQAAKKKPAPAPPTE